MFDCKVCQVLKEQIDYLRAQNKELTDRLLAVTNPHALAALHPEQIDINQFYGSSEEDVRLAFDEFGQQVVIDSKRSDQ